MGRIEIQAASTRHPITLIGQEAGICWGTNISDEEKNYKRGLDCLESEHGRTWEFPQIYLTIEGYSARVIREFYTHVGGLSTRLQSSTRYIDYKNFSYVTPYKVFSNENAKHEYDQCMKYISGTMQKLEALDIPREDIAMLLPLGMTTKVVCRMNLRTLIDMTKQRLCSRANWEFRELMFDIWCALSNYDPQWETLMKMYYKPKCEFTGFCNEKKSCGRMPRREENDGGKE